MPVLHAPSWGARVPFQFISADKPSLSITASQNALANNPASLKQVIGSVAKTDPDLLGIPHFRGDGEAPPVLSIAWKNIGFTDYLNLAALRPYPITMVTMRNLGYYGKLVLDGPDSVMSSQDVVAVNGTFYCWAPSDAGGAVSVARVTDPSAFSMNSGGANSGGIPIASDQYYYISFQSEYGETNVYGPNHFHNAADQVAISLTWTWPATLHCIGATIYNCTDNTGSNPKLVAFIPSSLTASWTDYVGYAGLTVTQALPTASTAYKGLWQQGLWFDGI